MKDLTTLQEVEAKDIDEGKKRAVFNIINEGRPTSGGEPFGPMYSAQVLSDAASKMEGKKAFLDHFEAGTSQNYRRVPGERSIKSLAGIWTEPYFSNEDKGINAIFQFSETEWNRGLWDLIKFQAENQDRTPAKLFGISAVLQAEVGYSKGEPSVRKIQRFLSADFVVNPALGGKFKQLLSDAGIDTEESKGRSFFLNFQTTKEDNSDMEKEDLIRENQRLKDELKSSKETIERLSSESQKEKGEIQKLSENGKKKDTEIKGLKEAYAKRADIEERLSKIPNKALKERIESLVLSDLQSGNAFDMEKIEATIKTERDYFDSVQRNAADAESEKSNQTPSANGKKKGDYSLSDAYANEGGRVPEKKEGN